MTVQSRTRRVWHWVWMALVGVATVASVVRAIVAGIAFYDGNGSSSEPSTSSSSARPVTAEPLSPSEPRTVHIDNPPVGQVPQCWRLRGTANLRADEVLIFGVQNLADSSGSIYFKTTNREAGKNAWSIRLYFGSDDSSVGQHYRVYVVVATQPAYETAYEAARAADNAREELWHDTVMPDDARVEQILPLYVGQDRIKGLL